jgi:hypothetical protein
MKRRSSLDALSSSTLIVICLTSYSLADVTNALVEFVWTRGSCGTNVIFSNGPNSAFDCLNLL